MNGKAETCPKPAPPLKIFERTKNSKGSTYYIIGEPERHWVASLPKSDLPLLDVGACYGVQTMHALRQGRNVIALDCCNEHLTVLRERVANMARTENTGQLMDVVLAELPSADAMDDESVSGILCSEVIHFMTPPELRLLFNDFYRWMGRGGRLVATVTSWPPSLKRFTERGFTFLDGMTVDKAYDILENKPASEVVDAGPGLFITPPIASLRAFIGDRFYALSKQELRYVSESSGFVVEELKYYSGGKYGDERTKKEPESVLLVATKP